MLQESGEFFYDYSNAIVGKALMRESLDDMKLGAQWAEAAEIEWEETDDEES